MVWVPSVPGLGVKVTEQLPAARVHVEGLKLPDLALVKVTLPVGVTAVPGEVSLTMAVHVVAAFTGSEEGAHTTLVEVERFATERLKLPELVE